MNKKNRFNVKIQALHQMSGSCFLVTVNFPDGTQTIFTIDCGRFSEEQKELNEYFPFDPSMCKFSINTHVHDDHFSRYPLFVKQGFKGKIYLSNISSKFANFILYNNSYINENEKVNDTYVEPIYNDDDVKQTLKQIYTCSYRKVFKPTKNISFMLIENGHVPGASMIYLTISYPEEDDITLLFTGDYHFKNTFFDVPAIPESITEKPVSLLVTESTYGTTNSYDKGQEKKLMDVTAKALEDGKTIIFPSFAFGRAQELVYLFSKAQSDGLIPKCNIYLDGSNAKYFHNAFIYEALGFKINTRILKPSNLEYIGSKKHRLDIIKDERPKIVIAPGGFSNYGSVTQHIKHGISKDNVLIFYTGYTSPDSVGGILRSAKKGDIISLFDHNFEMHCDVDFTAELSGHARKDDLYNHIFNNFKDIKSFLTNHGDYEISEAFTNDIAVNFPNSTVGLINSETCYTIDSNGIINIENISIY